MGDTQRSYNHEEEDKGMNLRIGNDGTNSNGHEEYRLEDRYLVKIVNS